MPSFILFSALTVLCFTLSTYVFRKGHPFTILALVIFNCGLIALDNVLFNLHVHVGFHITSHSNLILAFGLLVFFRNLHTDGLSKRDKILLGIACSEYVLIASIYLVYFLGGGAFFDQIPLFDIAQQFTRDIKPSLNPARDFARGKDFILFFVQLFIFPFAFYQIWKELKKAKDRHLDFFTSDSFEFYTWNFRFITLIAICYFPIVIIVFHALVFESTPMLWIAANILIGVFGLGLGLLTFFSPVYLKKEKGFSKMLEHFQKKDAVVLKEKENNNKYDKRITQLVQLLESQKIYQDPNLTLTSLAEQMDISSRHLSRVINKGFDKKFSEFINSYRVAEVKKSLLDPKYNHYNILGIGLEAGFNSKSSFYSAFKKETGMNPAQYKASHSEN